MDIKINGILDRAGDWILESGIQEANGGVARFYRADLGKNAPVSTEITGYAINGLRLAHQRTGEGKFLSALQRAAKFLTDTAWDSRFSIFPFEWTPEAPSSRAYFFDSGIIARGLLAAWRTTGERRFFDAAVCCGHSMSDNFRSAESIHPILSLPDKKPAPSEPRWSARPGCYQLKAALAWLQLHEETGEEVFRDAWEECLDWSLESHESFLPGTSEPALIMDRLHAYCYFLEGLLPVLDRQPCVKALAEGIDRVAHFLRQISPLFARSDVYAQLLRLRLYAGAARAVPFDSASAAQEAAACISFAFDSPDPRVNGAFSFGLKNQKLMPFANPVSTLFSMEALALWSGYQDAGIRTDWRELI